VTSVLLVAASLVFSTALISESTLSFLGLGLPPEEPSWGTMLNGAQQSALGGAWWTALFPGLAIAIAVAAANALGDDCRDRFDPHSRLHRAGAQREAVPTTQTRESPQQQTGPWSVESGRVRRSQRSRTRT